MRFLPGIPGREHLERVLDSPHCGARRRVGRLSESPLGESPGIRDDGRMHCPPRPHRSTLAAIASACLVCLLPATVTAQADKPTFVDLFDGKTLNGFEQKGGKAKYHVED